MIRDCGVLLGAPLRLNHVVALDLHWTLRSHLDIHVRHQALVRLSHRRARYLVEVTVSIPVCCRLNLEVSSPVSLVFERDTSNDIVR